MQIIWGLDAWAGAALESTSKAEETVWHILADLAGFGIRRVHP
jgi:hypothetical protein